MVERALKRRGRLRRKEVADYKERLISSVGSAPFTPEEPVDIAQGPAYDVLYANGEAVALILEGEPFPTVRGLLRSPASNRYVTVDMGAVPFVYNGADVMTPGITEADQAIRPGDLVWVRDERNRQPLAVGRALLTGVELVSVKHGKGVKTIHHVGDWLWKLDEG